MAFIVVAVAAASGRASADSFVVITGGLAAPISDKDWTNAVDPSLKLGARVGGGRPDLAGFVSFDFTPLATGGSSQFTDFSFQRYRVLGGVQLWKPIAGHLIAAARLAIGVDIAHASYTVSIPILGTSNFSDTNTGFAVEPAGGLWFDLGSTQVGFELGLPIGYHDKTAEHQGEFNFKYTSLDLDLLGAVRFGL